VEQCPDIGGLTQVTHTHTHTHTNTHTKNTQLHKHTNTHVALYFSGTTEPHRASLQVWRMPRRTGLIGSTR